MRIRKGELDINVSPASLIDMFLRSEAGLTLAARFEKLNRMKGLVAQIKQLPDLPIECECGAWNTWGKDCNIRFHSDWCPCRKKKPKYTKEQLELFKQFDEMLKNC